jgi:hypothetical protein
MSIKIRIKRVDFIKNIMARKARYVTKFSYAKQ